MPRRAKKNQPKPRQHVDITFSGDAFSIEAANGDGEPISSPDVDIRAYTGGVLSLRNFPNPVVINLDRVQAMDADQLPFLRDHAVDRPVGHGEPIVEASGLRHRGRLSVPGDDRDEIIQANGDGFRWQASVGGRIPDRRRNVQTVAAGSRVSVNGREFSGPIHVVNAFLWKETSFTAVGADEGRTSAAIAASLTQRVIPMNEFDKWLEASGFNPDDMSPEQLTSLRATWDSAQAAATPTPVVEPADPGIDMDTIVASATTAAVQAAQQASQRDRRIDRLFASYSSTSLSEDELSDLRANVEGGTVTEEGAHLQLLLASRGVGSTSSVGGSSRSSSTSDPMILEASVGRTAGLSEEQIHETLVANGATDDQAENAVTRSNGDPRGLKSIIRAVCNQAGHHCDEVGDSEIRAAMRYSEQHMDIEASGWSTVSLPGILSRLANKAMLAAYAEADNGGVALQIASTTSTRDFKKFSRYRMTESGVMTLVPGTGELKHTTLLEEDYENQVQTYGRMISLTRQMIRNDDMDAFLQIPRMMGRMGRHALEQITLTTLIDAPVAAGAGTTEFFHGAARGNQEPNYLEGATTGLSMDSLGPAYELFLNQVDTDGKPVMVDPSLLLCTNGDIITARKLFTDSQYRFTAASTTETINNQWQGMFEPVKSAYLHRLGATPSSLAWFLLGAPTSDVSALQIAFLDGQQTPIIQSAETSFNTLGMQMRGYFDFGVALQDPRAIVRVKGEA